ncbi:multifunctional oxoglutarate decarboxylase/oxoglutarate dehydrogenase thiamine pyrophosphate-binding subunit/dihydrolipoyllysine-residue succinyltransferase subunit [Tessaracoccus sp. ZS01]|uniref:multifunctional oxoglutarate decarboxylase/oxoglutarate dehydrogenase thiamine pyrophosphate-binding subunit/dihydrolipoyllysine-residue succinyltransferase subunit n=1 Tax=Tessaracoccus sp. ZS01 TaxID=1906324 RepID=UPI00096C12EC|nr:multifunctional oxoglutarate decarboxylase/oxoglutarate dehydrogenase thiamine pyrophosphate-binding subunit/dihydrolipoyllysine-residue succinyltransferase subunit [Tessaracoccus sp. ZS01]MCG6566303.1 multifunctional oxoglutarate decarboxylase/oxoglutarate dehydrogenase thiamine pyrophosphate-binding subunit/dihydrolipoyllysine-residue succinyltransferase subunit [Tessaracoccus sp. ZS01]OMG58777.1 alpha-ketoglutarate decarboxylase [Tessaracoccus sp. ZS01]
MSAPDSNDLFGANSWLIDEKREAYDADPQSVDATWREFFAAEGAPPQPAAVESAAPPTSRAAEKPQAMPRAETKPAPKPETKPEAKSERPKSPEAKQREAASGLSDAPAPKPAAAKTESKPTVEKVTTGRNAPHNPGTGAGLSANTPNPNVRPEPTGAQPKYTVLRGAPMRTAKNMDTSLTVPTATSVRSVPMKLVIDQRVLINNFLRQSKGGKVSFTHLIGYAMVQALKAMPEMNNAYDMVDGKPNLIENPSINLGIAIDIQKGDTRQLLVPNIKGCENFNFFQFWSAYEQVVRKTRAGDLQVSDFAGTTASLTNPGGIGTNHSVPRLMTGQGMILGVGNIDYPAEFQGMSESKMTDLAVSKVTTLTSTYDHRVIQGATSGEFLKTMHGLLLGENGFYDEIFEALRIPYEPLRWAGDISAHRDNQVSKTARVLELINSYRAFGHLVADTDPLEYRQRSHEDLRLETHGLSIWDLDRQFAVGTFGGSERTYLPLRDIISTLQDSYCRTVGIEYMHIPDPRQRRWFQQRMEKQHQALTHDEHMHALDKLNEAEIFETFLQTKFVGQKRFSLEGGESVIVLLDEIAQQAANDSVDEVCIGMPHRGRLNVLANIVGKSYGQIFREFDGQVDRSGTGDVKYHLGAEGTFVASNGATVKTSVAANPSHLEAVNPVLQGIARAKQDMLRQSDYPVLPLTMHGDASFAGQGVVFETLQMSQLRGYKTGGTIHVVVNNQVGFTTAPTESRSSTYSTDVAKSISAPVLHVNGDDPDSCIRAARIAFEYRQTFHKDVVIDMVCYRRRGHNEGDDPSFTQPNMYDLIEQKRSTRRLYTESLIGRGDISMADAEDVMNRFRARLENVFREVRDSKGAPDEYRKVPYYPTKPEERLTEITTEMLQRIANVHTQFPEGFAVHPKVQPQLERRAEAIMNGPIDWATAEMIAIGSLLIEGRPVRMAGQDSRRGTFSQRFAAIVDRVTNEAWVPLKHLTEDQATFEVWDSLLSEYAALGFEYGYSVARPDALVLWEAQFGDFVNGAQIISDEFVASGNAKWGQKSGVCLLLPHGYEGQGPDHSSARIERWLQLCAEGALAVCQPSTPANHFHLLRQHAYVNWHRPVVIATPKSMLRNKLATSTPEEFTSGRWHPALDDPTIKDPSKVERIVLCSGKVRWDLVARREKNGHDGKIAIIALERLYPLPAEELVSILRRYSHVSDIRFVQDEPENQGAWPFMSVHLPGAVKELFPEFDMKMTRVTRPWSSAPSVGSMAVHKQQEEDLLRAALG